MTVTLPFRTGGRVEVGGAAAIAALKLRAVEWDIPLSDAGNRLVLPVWGGRIEMVPDPPGVGIALHAPENRLMLTLQDSVTELLAGHGIAVQWDHVAEGALAPGLSLMRVVSVVQVSPGFLRVRLQGRDAARFALGGLHFRLLLPPQGRQGAPVWPRIDATGRAIWPTGADALHKPVYTTVAQQQDWLEFDIWRHPDSPTCDWADTAATGQVVGVMGPGGGDIPVQSRLALFGDQTAWSAIRRILDGARAEVRAFVAMEPDDLGPYAGDPRLRITGNPIAALQETGADDGTFVWFAGEAAQVTAARAYLLARGLTKDRFLAATYWRQGA